MKPFSFSLFSFFMQLIKFFFERSYFGFGMVLTCISTGGDWAKMALYFIFYKCIVTYSNDVYKFKLLLKQCTDIHVAQGMVWCTINFDNVHNC
jgi:hypothetical protein